MERLGVVVGDIEGAMVCHRVGVSIEGLRARGLLNKRYRL